MVRGRAGKKAQRGPHVCAFNRIPLPFGLYKAFLCGGIPGVLEQMDESIIFILPGSVAHPDLRHAAGTARSGGGFSRISARSPSSGRSRFASSSPGGTGWSHWFITRRSTSPPGNASRPTQLLCGRLRMAGRSDFRSSRIQRHWWRRPSTRTTTATGGRRREEFFTTGTRRKSTWIIGRL